MFCIKYKVDGQEGIWIDPNTRGNREHMTYHDRGLADQECTTLCNQYYQEGFTFWVETYTPDLVPA